METQSDNDPVTVCISRKVKPGKESDYEQWIKGITAAASTFQGHLGMNVLRPNAKTGGEYVTIYRFDTYAHARLWEQADVRQQWIDKLDDIVESTTKVHKITGLEFWFDLPNMPVSARPNPHKMALVLMVVVYSLVLSLNIILAPLIGHFDLWLRLIVIIALQVLLMTYVVMPRVSVLLKSWLYH